MKRIFGFLKDNLIFTFAILFGATALVLAFTGHPNIGNYIAIGYVSLVIILTAIDMIRDIIRGHYGLDILALVAIIATLAVGEFAAAMVIVLMLTGGEALEDFAQKRASGELNALLERSPQTAHVIKEQDGVEAVVDVPVAQVRVGDNLLVRPAEVVPVDAKLISADADFDESSITGESLPVSKNAGDEVWSGVVNGSAAVRISAIRSSEESQFQQIAALVKKAQESKAPTVRIADRFAIPFTIFSLLIAGLAWFISGDPLRFAQVLVLATPCPLLIAAPVAFIGGLSRVAKRGAIVKGGAALERLARIKSAAFDKTGTLTLGQPVLVDIEPASGFSEDELLQLVASAEQYSSHVLASGIVAAAKDKKLTLLTTEKAEEAATNGVIAWFNGRRVVVGKLSYIANFVSDSKPANLQSGELAVYVAVDDAFAGVLKMSDPVRPESAGVISWLHSQGIEPTIMLTGDAKQTAEDVAKQLGISQVYSELIPQQKVELAAGFERRPLMVVGDGINDAPVLAASDVGIAMGARGATAAAEAADVVVMRDDLSVVQDAVYISKRTLRIAYTAIWMGIILSIGLMLIATTGIIPAIDGAILQEVVDLAAILYALRALGGKDKNFG